MTMRKTLLPSLIVAAALGSMRCGGWETSRTHADAGSGEQPGGGGEGGAASPPRECSIDTTAAVPVAAPRDLHVVGNEIRNAEGRRIVLRGVNRSGSEYMCLGARGFFDGPGFGDDAEASVRAIAAWNINAVRVPLNESCWLAISGAPKAYSGENYKAAIRDYVELLQRYGIVPILDLHWAAPGDVAASRLQPMPNADHSPRFWADVATTFADNSGVIFEAYNEPYPDQNRDTAAAWSCWRDGCEVTRSGILEDDTAPRTYAAAGMQALVDAIRDTGSRHVILLGGVQYSNALAGWLEYRPDDRLGQIGAAWHVYNFNACSDLGCFAGVPATVAREVPLVATEIGQNDCEGSAFLSPLLEFLDAQAVGRLAWSWNAYGPCSPEMRPGHSGQPWSLVTDYRCPEPNSNYARTYFEHLTALRRE
jgi:hypothetical protein